MNTQLTTNIKKVIFTQLQGLSQEACNGVLNGSNPISILSSVDVGTSPSQILWQIATGIPKKVYKSFVYKGAVVSISDRGSHYLVHIK